MKMLVRWCKLLLKPNKNLPAKRIFSRLHSFRVPVCSPGRKYGVYVPGRLVLSVQSVLLRDSPCWKGCCLQSAFSEGLSDGANVLQGCGCITEAKRGSLSWTAADLRNYQISATLLDLCSTCKQHHGQYGKQDEDCSHFGMRKVHDVRSSTRKCSLAQECTVRYLIHLTG